MALRPAVTGSSPFAENRQPSVLPRTECRRDGGHAWGREACKRHRLQTRVGGHMGLTSEQAHWIVGGELSLLALALMLYETRVWRFDAVRYAPAATLLLLLRGRLGPAAAGRCRLATVGMASAPADRYARYRSDVLVPCAAQDGRASAPADGAAPHLGRLSRRRSGHQDGYRPSAPGSSEIRGGVARTGFPGGSRAAAVYGAGPLRAAARPSHQAGAGIATTSPWGSSSFPASQLQVVDAAGDKLAAVRLDQTIKR